MNTNSDKTIQFDKLVQSLLNPDNLRGRGRLCIRSGEFDCQGGSGLEAMLKAWQLPAAGKMPYVVWETMDRLELSDRVDFSDAAYFLQGRIFGPWGDLSLRRDGERVRWLLVAEMGAEENKAAGEGFPKAFLEQLQKAKDFFTAEEDASFYCHAGAALLWGEKKPGQAHWQDDRVARAKLVYPGQSAQRVQVNYIEYSRAGQVEFVRYGGLDGYSENRSALEEEK